MEDNPALPDQGPGEFPLQMEIEEDLEQEIENFVRLKRLGQYKKAHEMFEEVLTRHIAFFPVVAEYADLLLEQGRYGVLSKFLDIQIECMESVFEEDEVELLRIMRSLALIHTKGALRAALARASKTWMFLQRTGTKLTLANFPSDVQIHTFEIYIYIIVFAMNTSSWVTKSHMDCPWNISAPKGLQCGFIQWYQALATKNDDWNASRVLIAVLKILPSLPFEDQKVAYKSYCFGTYEPEDYELNPLSENQILTGFTVSLSRAQALMDLALMLRLRYPNGFQHEERFTDWYLSYNAALKYHSLASWFLSNVLDIEQVNLHRLKFEAQNTRFSQFLLSDLDPRAELDPSLKSVRIFPEWTLPLITSSDSERTSPRAEARNYKFDIPTLLNIQLHENVDLIGYIETCATLHSGIPCTSENDWSDTGSENKNSYPCAVAFDDLAFQTLSVALPLTEQDSISQYSRVIIDTSNGIIPTERTTSAAVKDFDFHQDSESEAFDIPLYLLFLHIFRGTSSGTLYDKTATLLPTLISDIRIETAAGVIQDIFEAELRGEQSRSKEHSFLTNEILCTIGNIKSDPSLSSYIWEVVKICLQAQAAYMSIKEEWSRLRFSNVVSSILDLEWSLASAEKEMIQRWYSHILACGFRCERDDPVSRHHMKHILAMLEETLSNHLDPLAEEDISRDIPIVRSAVNLALKFTTSILDDQRQRITRAKLFDNQSNSPSSVARQKLQKKSQHENEYSGNTSSGGHQESFRGTLDSIVEPAEVYRDLYDEEMLVVEDLERHIAICLTCDLAIREIRLDYQGVCELGHKLAVDASQYIYSKDGHYFSSLFSGTRFGRARRLNLPRNFTTTRTLLKAVEKGLELHFHGRENTTNTSISGPSRHPSQSQHDERSRVAELDVSFERACSSISGDSGYDSRAPSANSYERPLHGAGHPLSQPKTILHTTRLPHSKGGRPQSSLRSYGTMNLEEIEQEEAWSDESHDHSGNPASHT